jgi:hypothetical protein
MSPPPPPPPSLLTLIPCGHCCNNVIVTRHIFCGGRYKKIYKHVHDQKNWKNGIENLTSLFYLENPYAIHQGLGRVPGDVEVETCEEK